MLNWCNILTWLCLLDLGRITESNSDSTFYRVKFRPKWLIGLLFSKKHFWLGISSRVESHQPVENSPKVELFLRVSTRLFPWIYASLNHFRLGVVCRANQHCCEPILGGNWEAILGHQWAQLVMAAAASADPAIVQWPRVTIYCCCCCSSYLWAAATAVVGLCHCTVT